MSMPPLSSLLPSAIVKKSSSSRQRREDPIILRDQKKFRNGFPGWLNIESPSIGDSRSSWCLLGHGSAKLLALSGTPLTSQIRWQELPDASIGTIRRDSRLLKKRRRLKDHPGF